MKTKNASDCSAHELERLATHHSLPVCISTRLGFTVVCRYHSGCAKHYDLSTVQPNEHFVECPQVRNDRDFPCEGGCGATYSVPIGLCYICAKIALYKRVTRNAECCRHCCFWSEGHCDHHGFFVGTLKTCDDYYRLKP